MEHLGEVQKGIFEIENLDAEVIAISTRGYQKDVESTKISLGITYTLIPKPNEKFFEDFGIRLGSKAAAYGTIILDEKGVIRFRRFGFYPNPRWASPF